MELPFAVTEEELRRHDGNADTRSNVVVDDEGSSGGSLVTASSQGSFLAEAADFVDVPQSQHVFVEEDVGDCVAQRGDILAVLLSNDRNALLTQHLQDAGTAAALALRAKRDGELQRALAQHTRAANLYRDCALKVKPNNRPLYTSLLLLSQTQAKSAIALKRVVRLNSNELRQLAPSSQEPHNTGPPNPQSSSASPSKDVTKQERLRAVVRGALGSGRPHEADISDSIFLGRASSDTSTDDTARQNHVVGADQDRNANNNPVDEMMQLEQELRDMDMTLGLGQSISSLDARMQHANHQSRNAPAQSASTAAGKTAIDGSFMVVPPGSQSYMASSMWGGSSSVQMPTQTATPQHKSVPPTYTRGTAGARARANRLANLPTSRILNAPVNPSTGNPAGTQQQQQQQQQQSQPSHIIVPAQSSHHQHLPSKPTVDPERPNSLESSWWGGPPPGSATVAASQVLANSVLSTGSRAGSVVVPGVESATTKQVLRLMDALKTLGDENATLLRQVEDAEAARAEAKAAREQMKRFKTEYAKRFKGLQLALESYRTKNSDGNPVDSSEYVRAQITMEQQLQQQAQQIRELKNELSKEKENSRKKAAALRKYESFYREVKLRSAQKTAMRKQQSSDK